MTRYADVSLTIRAENAHFTTARNIHVTFSQENGAKVDVTGDDIEVIGDEEMVVTLSQEQTAVLQANASTRMQINMIDANGLRKPSEIVTVPVLENLLNRVIA